MNDTMYEKLLKCLKARDIVSVYSDQDDLESSFVGFLAGIDEDYFILQHITPNGYYDGYVLGVTANIFRIECSGQYQKKILKLYHSNYAKEKLNPISIKANLIESIFYFAQENNLMVSIEINGDEMSAHGFVSDYNAESIIARQITEYGEDDGEVYLDVGDITRIDCDTDYEQSLLILYRNQETLL